MCCFRDRISGCFGRRKGPSVIGLWFTEFHGMRMCCFGGGLRLGGLERRRTTLSCWLWLFVFPNSFCNVLESNSEYWLSGSAGSWDDICEIGIVARDVLRCQRVCLPVKNKFSLVSRACL